MEKYREGTEGEAAGNGFEGIRTETGT